MSKLKIKWTSHALERFYERVGLSHQDLNLLISKEIYFFGGYEHNKKHLGHYVFYCPYIEDWLVLVLDKNTYEVVTSLLVAYDSIFYDLNLLNSLKDDTIKELFPDKVKKISKNLQAIKNIYRKYIEQKRFYRKNNLLLELFSVDVKTCNKVQISNIIMNFNNEDNFVKKLEEEFDTYLSDKSLKEPYLLRAKGTNWCKEETLLTIKVP